FVSVPQAQVAALGAFMKSRDVLINAAPVTRLVTHLDVNRAQLETVVAYWREFLQQAA
ncbi:low-specificity L-threonine aldolase, partial [Klebsiella pneumoniae]|nr:low-specificity L-threonine aldolase [Klebsiella pneumoniae]